MDPSTDLLGLAEENDTCHFRCLADHTVPDIDPELGFERIDVELLREAQLNTAVGSSSHDRGTGILRNRVTTWKNFHSLFLPEGVNLRSDSVKPN